MFEAKVNVKRLTEDYLSNKSYIDKITIESLTVYYPYFTAAGENISVAPKFFFGTMLPKIAAGKVKSFEYRISKEMRQVFCSYEVTPLNVSDKQIYLPKTVGKTINDMVNAFNEHYKQCETIFCYGDKIYTAESVSMKDNDLADKKVSIIDISEISEGFIIVTLADQQN